MYLSNSCFLWLTCFCHICYFPNRWESFAKSIKSLAEARVKVNNWSENSSGNHELILNELSFMDEEIVTALSAAKSKGEKADKKNAEAKNQAA